VIKKIFFLIILSASLTCNNSHASQDNPKKEAAKQESKMAAEAKQKKEITIQDEIQKINQLVQADPIEASKELFQVFSGYVKKLNELVLEIKLEFHNPSASQMNNIIKQIEDIHQILENFGRRVVFGSNQRLEMTCLNGNMKSFIIRLAKRMNVHRVLIPDYYELTRNWENIILMCKQLDLLQPTVSCDYMRVTEEFYPYFQLRNALEEVEVSIDWLQDLNSSNGVDSQIILEAEKKARAVVVEVNKVVEKYSKITVGLPFDDVQIIDILNFLKNELEKQIKIYEQTLKIIDAVIAVPVLSVAAIKAAESKRSAETELDCPQTPRGSKPTSIPISTYEETQIPAKKPAHAAIRVDTKEEAEGSQDLISKFENYSKLFAQDTKIEFADVQQACQDIKKALDTTDEFLKVLARNNLKKIDGFQYILCKHDWENTDKAMKSYVSTKEQSDLKKAWNYSRNLLKDTQKFADLIVARLKHGIQKKQSIQALLLKIEGYSKQFTQEITNVDAQQSNQHMQESLVLVANFFNEFENEPLKKFIHSFEYLVCSTDRKHMIEAMKKYESTKASSDIQYAARKNKELLKHAKDLAGFVVARLSKKTK
jgi:hypothetical protein